MTMYYRNTEIALVEEEEKTIIMVPSTGKIHELDEVSSFIWKKIPEKGVGVSAQNIAEGLVQVYDVEFDIAFNDVLTILKTLFDEMVIMQYELAD